MTDILVFWFFICILDFRKKDDRCNDRIVILTGHGTAKVFSPPAHASQCFAMDRTQQSYQQGFSNRTNTMRPMERGWSKRSTRLGQGCWHGRLPANVESGLWWLVGQGKQRLLSALADDDGRRPNWTMCKWSRQLTLACQRQRGDSVVCRWRCSCRLSWRCRRRTVMVAPAAQLVWASGSGPAHGGVPRWRHFTILTDLHEGGHCQVGRNLRWYRRGSNHLNNVTIPDSRVARPCHHSPWRVTASMTPRQKYDSWRVGKTTWRGDIFMRLKNMTCACSAPDRYCTDEISIFRCV